MAESCLVSRLSRYAPISPRETEFLARMEETEVRHAAGAVVQPAGEDVDAIYVLKHGWAVQKGRFRSTKEQIIRIYVSGEVMGLAEIGPRVALHPIVMQTEGVVCRFPREGLTALYRELPRLAALFTAVGSLDHLDAREKIAAMGLLSAEDRLIHFLLDLRARLAVANVGLGNRFRLPFSQAEIGQALGLTSIYVNRLLRKLVTEKRIEVERPYIRLLDRTAMERQVGFTDRYRSIDTSWFPAE